MMSRDCPGNGGRLLSAKSRREPLLFKAAEWLTFGNIPDGYSVNMHPMAFAAWFGMLATALNLFPIGQLDGGHISYAVLGRRSTAGIQRRNPSRDRLTRTFVMPIRSILAGCGGYLPARIVTNDELARTIDTSDEWIRERTGIDARHFQNILK